MKPVARGFATTSIPKKAVQTEEIAPPADDVSPSDGLVTEAADASADSDQAALQDPVKLDAEQSDEQQFLQVMVDKYQEKTEKELSRTIKACSPSHPAPVPRTLTLVYFRRSRWTGVSPEGSTL